ncbi:ABC transporter family protein (macronuclear) [Tetrahymena thermophila SB210]|uniref:ABC transporter family protein n=1 Tax=Tetrahymena thermophila (strain SB210) TaxID=312017 RepID=I7MKR3_TETTS|nr:ABC transporter family protein [Tetrahymena thermophila SB210]EAR99877.2 ABC transporter family protein [Tetrahymena thermophila SB210]|eukprot:XP_001020122.2 ABC transporter family protein [Tetrahymena thermophila SB210]
MSSTKANSERNSLDIENSFQISHEKGSKNSFKSRLQSNLLMNDDDQFQDDEQYNRQNTYSQGYSFPMRVLWFHFYSILKKLKQVESFGRKFQIDDLPQLENHVKVETTNKLLKGQIEHLDPQKVSQYSFLWILGKTFKKDVFGILGYVFLEGLSKIFSPLCTAQIITCVKNQEVYLALVWVLCLVFANFFGTTFGQNSWTKAQRLSVQLRLGLVNILYDKVSNLSAYSVKKANVGKIINMISSDFSSFENNGVYIFHCILSPFLLVLASWILISRLGFAGVISIILLVLLFPLQKTIAQRASNYTKLQTKERDQKVKIFSEMIQGIRIIKMYGWEKAFNSIINSYRNKEIVFTQINQLYVYLEQVISLNGPLFVALFCFLLVDIFSENKLDTAIIFSTIELINLVSVNIMRNIGYGLNFIFDFKVLVQRYMSIMSIENVQMKSIDSNQTANSHPSGNTLVLMKDFYAYWATENLDSKPPVLSQINFQITKGETISFIGQIGSGKTSILYAIMKEIPRYKGQFFSTSNLAYVEQEPYILQGTVRDNILFGKTYDEDFYQQVVSACCLQDDFIQFDKGDLTIIGERGANLSGGQKARVCLARAVYANTDLYLLDDPLSAVDSKVAKKIFSNVINGLLKDKAVILVTHQLNYALKCQRIAVFDNGQIILQGKPKEIDFTSSVLSKFIEQSHSKDEETEDPSEVSANQSDDQTKDQIDELIDTDKNKHIQQNQNKEITIQASQSKAENSILSDQNKKEEEFPVTVSTYIQFIKMHPKSALFFLVLTIFILHEVLFTTFYKILSTYDINEKSSFYFMVFACLLTLITFKYLQNSSSSIFILGTTKNMSQKMTTSLCQAKPILFDEIPSGSIINKYSNDVNILDKSLPDAAASTMDGVLHFINLLFSVIYFNHFFVIPGVIEVYLFYKWFMYIKSVLMRAKQLDLENKTPVFQFFQSSLSGLLIINIYGQKESFKNRMATLMNNSIRTYDVFWFISRLFSVYMQYTALLTSALGIVIVLLWSNQTYGQFSQTFAFLMLLTNFLHLTLRSFINMDTFMTSSERAQSIIKLPKEKIEVSEVECQQQQESSNSIKNSYQNYNLVQTNIDQDTVIIDISKQGNINNSNLWPQKGEVKFEKVYMKYKQELNHVLKGVSFEVNPLERVAIVGRTGAGKSSIIQSLFRMSEIDYSSSEGQSRILYDSQDIKDISLHQLRKKISIIPQTPFVFSGSIRQNIDPLNEFSNEEIICVLKETGLYELVQKLPNSINTDMSDASSVFSMGQKQLVCLARVMLRKNKLMILDEATSSVDMETDQKIQQLLKEKFSDTSIITIAHRLNTIADYDKVIVLEQGKVIQVGSCFELLALNENDEQITNKESAFAQMVLHTGPKNAEQIFEISKTSYLNKKKSV